MLCPLLGELHDLLEALGASLVKHPLMFTYDVGLEQIILMDTSKNTCDKKHLHG